MNPDLQPNADESLPAFVARLDDMIPELEDNGTFEEWVYANLQRSFAAALIDHEDELLKDLTSLEPGGLIGSDFVAALARVKGDRIAADLTEQLTPHVLRPGERFTFIVDSRP